MNTQISTKLAALTIAVMMNSLMLGGVAILFSSGVQHPAPALAQATTLTHASALVKGHQAFC